jgi:hypothetical protein
VKREDLGFFRTWKRRAQIVFCLAFGLFLWLPVLEQTLGFDPTPAPEENRNLAEFPEWEESGGPPEEYAARFEDYYKDHFGFRNWLIRHHNAFKFHLLGVSPNPSKVVLGKEGWLFEATKDLTDLMRNNRPFSASEVAEYQVNLESNWRWLQKRGIPYLVVYVPEAWSIHPEFLPEGFEPVHEESHTDQILSHLKQNSPVDFLDLRPLLMEASERIPVYRTQDPHWNEEGAYLAYLEVVRALQRHFPDMKPLEGDRILRREFDAPGGYLNRALSLPEELMEHHYRVEVATPTVENRGDPFETLWKGRESPRFGTTVEYYRNIGSSSAELPRLVFFHDSFGNLFLPWLTENFAETYSVRYPPFSRQIVEWVEPDIVISLFAERNITMKKVASW